MSDVMCSLKFCVSLPDIATHVSVPLSLICADSISSANKVVILLLNTAVLFRGGVMGVCACVCVWECKKK